MRQIRWRKQLAATAVCVVVGWLVGVAHAAAAETADPLVRGWRGDWTGRFPEARPVTAWNVERGLNVLWRVPLKQYTNAQPLIVGGRIYTLAEPRTLICLDKMTGKLVWVNPGVEKPTTDPAELQAAVEERLLPGAQPPAGAPPFVPWSQRKLGYGQFAGSSMPTPVTDGKHIWTKNGGMAWCYDTEGVRVWAAETHLAGTDHPMNVPSPLLIGNVLVCEGGSTPYWAEKSMNKVPDGTFALSPNPNKGVKHWMVGLEADTGKLLWDIGPLKGGGYGGPSSPVPLKLADGAAQATFVLTGEGCVIRPSDGKLLVPYAGGRSGSASPVLIGPRALFGTSALVEFALRGPDKVEATLVWTGKNYAAEGGAAVHAGVIYTLTATGEVRLHAVEEATGKYLRFIVLLPFDNPAWPACATAGKYLFMLTGQHVYVVEPGPTPVLLAANDTDRTYSGPIFDGERMYLRSFDALTCVALKGEDGARYEREVQAKTLLLPFPATLAKRALVEPAPLPKGEKPGAGVPVVKIEPGKMPASWLVAGPYPGVGKDLPAALADPAARPTRGTNVTVGETTKAFAPPERGTISANGLNVLKATAGARGVHLFYYTLFDVPADGHFRFAADQPCVQAWVNGQALATESALKLVAGRYTVLLKVTVTADCPPEAKPSVKVLFAEAPAPDEEQARNLAYVRENAAILQRVVDLLPGSPEAVRAAALLQAAK